VSHPSAALAGSGPEVGFLAWTFEPAVVVPVIAAAALYLRGWSHASQRMPERFRARHLVIFAAGLASVVLALCSPLDALAHDLALAHMIQHLLLMVVAPPLVWMSAPVAPILSGLPKPVRRAVVIALASAPIRMLTRLLADPRVSWAAFVLVFWAWHLPALYDQALRVDFWHHVQHVCFFATAMLFWRPVILSWPARSAWPRWAMLPYVVLAELQNAGMAAILTFADRVLYPAYDAAPRRWPLSALEDQSIAGVIMWVPGSLPFVLAALWLVMTVIVAPPRATRSRTPSRRSRTATSP
jgi:cytochrome c oxidase assembly factor CtaG